MSFSSQWGWVMGSVASFTQVAAYDRPGMGWSDASPSQLEADELIEQVRFALQAAGLEAPYLLVGHSMGALTMWLFAEMYPDEVAGLVLVDPRLLEWDSPSENEVRLQTTPIEKQIAAIEIAAIKIGLLQSLRGRKSACPSAPSQ
jgi:pimeloyl-ACP methyl ester carboxylesterase